MAANHRQKETATDGPFQEFRHCFEPQGKDEGLASGVIQIDPLAGDSTFIAAADLK